MAEIVRLKQQPHKKLVFIPKMTDFLKLYSIATGLLFDACCMSERNDVNE